MEILRGKKRLTKGPWKEGVGCDFRLKNVIRGSIVKKLSRHAHLRKGGELGGGTLRKAIVMTRLWKKVHLASQNPQPEFRPEQGFQFVLELNQGENQ